MHVFGILCQKQFGNKFTGFCDPGVLNGCQENLGALLRTRADMAAGMSCLQPLLAGGHFVVSAKLPGKEHVIVFNSLSGPLSSHFKLQLFMLYNVQNKAIQVHLPPVQQQSLTSNVCGPLVCAFMSEILFGGDPTGMIYVREKGIRKWLDECLQTELLTTCPKRGG